MKVYIIINLLNLLNVNTLLFLLQKILLKNDLAPTRKTINWISLSHSNFVRQISAYISCFTTQEPWPLI